MQAVLKLAQRGPCQWRRVKGKPMHAVFAEVEQQCAEQDQGKMRFDQARQESHPLENNGRQQCGHTAVTEKHEKHLADLRWWRHGRVGQPDPIMD
jgi:hypothetical protein